MSLGKLILDTIIVSYLMKGGALTEAYKPYVENCLLAISFITVGELYFGAETGNRARAGGMNSKRYFATSFSSLTTMRLLAATVGWSQSGSEPESRLHPPGTYP